MKYTIGLDYGTLSVRALLLELDTGREVAESVFTYPHGVMDEALPDGTKLGVDWALQQPQDYIDGLVTTVRGVLEQADIDPVDVIGIGVDFTACTMLPTMADGTPICFLDEYAGNPHAYAKLWKHHAASKQARWMTEVALERNEEFLKRMGGGISSEWLFPKILETFEQAPQVYAAAERFVEACDWIVQLLTGKEMRNSCAAGFKALWDVQNGYPSQDYLNAMKPGFGDVIGTKVLDNVVQTGSLAGGLTEKYAQKFGLCAGTAVAVGVMDAHAAFPSLGVTEPGVMMSIIGTSSCHEVMVDSEDLIDVPGMCGASKDGLLPGYYCYEMGQAGVGDSFNWFVDHCVTAEYQDEAEAKGIGLHTLLNEKAIALRPGQSGLIALDWWNGNRSVLNNSDLSGCIVGCTVQTKLEEIYRALIESTAFGMRMILDAFMECRIEINSIVVCGGIGERSKMAMQIYADVLGVEIKLAKSAQAAARGAAIYGACAAGKAAGGFDDQYEAVRKLGAIKGIAYTPDAANQKAYDKLFTIYRRVHDFFGIEQADIMSLLKEHKR